MTLTPEEIAEGLSEAQRRALLEAAEGSSGELQLSTYSTVRKANGCRWRLPLQTIRKLQHRGLIGPYPYPFTPLGLQVREHLAKGRK